MSENKNPVRTEFRYNRRRKHYSYIYKQKGDYRYNLLMSSNEYIRRKNKIIGRNVPLYKHPNPNKPNEKSYIMTRRYVDHKNDFGPVKKNWFFHIFDRLKIKKIKKGKWK